MGKAPVPYVSESDAWINKYSPAAGLDVAAQSTDAQGFRPEYMNFHAGPFHSASYTRRCCEKRIFSEGVFLCGPFLGKIDKRACFGLIIPEPETVALTP
jgi:hypothetical protein